MALIIGIGSAGSANAAKADNHGCIVGSNGFTYNCLTGQLSWDATVTVTAEADTAVLYKVDTSTTPAKQKLVAGPVKLPHGPGPASVVLAAFPCGDFQFDVVLPGKGFLAGHKGSNGPCTPPSTTTTTTPPVTTTTTTPPVTTTTTTPPVTTTTTTPPVTKTTTPPVTTTTTTPPVTTTTTTPPVTTTTTTPPVTTTSTTSSTASVPPSTTFSTSAVDAASATSYDLAPVAAGVTVADNATTSGASITAGQALLVLVALVALWLMFGAPRPHLNKIGR